MASLMPLQKSICPWKSPPQLRPFVQQDFMKTLEKAGPQLTSRLKGDWIGLYRWTHTLCSCSKDNGQAPKLVKYLQMTGGTTAFEQHTGGAECAVLSLKAFP